MAAPGGSGDLAVAAAPARDQSALERLLASEPYLFDFFQAVRLLERAQRDRVPVGRFANPNNEIVRFSIHNSLVFPASQIQGFSWRTGQAPLMLINFMGLTGPEGVLPLYYTQLLMERARARDTSPRDFFDIFNHRIVSLFYRAWEKYRLTVEYERGGQDRSSHYLLDLIGLGTAGLRNRQSVPDHSLIYYAGLLGQQPRSASALRQLLEDYFEVPVRIEQFAGAWYKLTREMQCNLEEGTDSERIAFGAVVGDEIWDEQVRVRILLGPLTLEQYLDFLPCGTAFQPLRALTRFYSGDQLDFEVKLMLRRDEVPRCELGREDKEAPRLGWVTWNKSVPMGRDPADTVLQL